MLAAIVSLVHSMAHFSEPEREGLIFAVQSQKGCQRMEECLARLVFSAIAVTRAIHGQSQLSDPLVASGIG